MIILHYSKQNWQFINLFYRELLLRTYSRHRVGFCGEFKNEKISHFKGIYNLGARKMKMFQVQTSIKWMSWKILCELWRLRAKRIKMYIFLKSTWNMVSKGSMATKGGHSKWGNRSSKSRKCGSHLSAVAVCTFVCCWYLVKDAVIICLDMFAKFINSTYMHQLS